VARLVVDSQCISVMKNMWSCRLDVYSGPGLVVPSALVC